MLLVDFFTKLGVGLVFIPDKNEGPSIIRSSFSKPKDGPVGIGFEIQVCRNRTYLFERRKSKQSKEKAVTQKRSKAPYLKKAYSEHGLDMTQDVRQVAGI